MIFLLRLLSLLPLSWLHRMGALAGWLTYLFSPRYRRHLKENLAQAGFAGNLALKRQAIASAGMQVLELPRIWGLEFEKAAAQVIEVSGWEHVEAAREKAGGILFLTPHLGCFEISALYYAKFDDITVLYRPPKKNSLHPFLIQARKRETLHLAATDISGVRSLIRALKSGKAIGILPDQAPKSGEGIWSDFFDRPAYTMTLAARLSRTEATVLFAWCERLPAGKGYRFHVRPPEEPFSGDIPERVRQINAEIETMIRQCPSQYLWGYHRYKGRYKEATAKN